MADNLERQGGTYHVRLAIPKDVQHTFGNRRILSKSLDTTDRNEAMRRRLPYLTKWKAQIQAARSAKADRGDAWKESASTFATGIAEAAEASKIAIALRKPEPYSSDAPSPEIAAAMNALFSDSEYMEALQQLAAIRKEQGTDGHLGRNKRSSGKNESFHENSFWVDGRTIWVGLDCSKSLSDA